MVPVSDDYPHYGVATSQPGWGAMTEPVGARTDKAIQRCREGLAGFLNATTPWSWSADAPERVATRTRNR